MNWLRRFMYGRYGFDQFTRALIIFSLILSVITTLLRVPGLIIIAYLPFFYALFRTVSKDYQRRSGENNTYIRFAANVKNKVNHLKLWLVGTRTHKYYSCPKCKQIIRVPRGKGKIAITCPKCKNEFVRRT